MKIIRKLYDWVLHWAYTPYGAIALFLLAFAESSFFPIPPDILLIALAISIPKKSFKYALICSIGSLTGGILGYYIGYKLWGTVDIYFYKYVPGFTKEIFNMVKMQYDNYDFWVVFTAGFTPIPYKVITITAGVFNINFFIFVLASAISRSARFFIVAFLIYVFGIKVKNFIDRYFNVLSIVFMMLLIGGFVLVKFFIK